MILSKLIDYIIYIKSIGKIKNLFIYEKNSSPKFDNPNKKISAQIVMQHSLQQTALFSKIPEIKSIILHVK